MRGSKGRELLGGIRKFLPKLDLRLAQCQVVLLQRLTSCLLRLHTIHALLHFRIHRGVILIE